MHVTFAVRWMLVRMKGLLMKTFEFTVILKDKDEISLDDADRLFEAGCDDALPGSRGSVAMIHFSRESETLRDALLSAQSNVEQAGFSILRIELASDELAALGTP
jgi:hypothetical protein